MRVIDGAERDALLLKILDGIDCAVEAVTPFPAMRLDTWNRHWSQNAPYLQYAANADGICRVNGSLCHAPGYEAAHLRGLLDEALIEHIKPLDEVREYGAGAGHNLAYLRSKGTMRCIGYDWSSAAVAAMHAKDIAAEVMDMFLPAHNVKHRPHAALTVHAMEQLGGLWQAFADFLIVSRPQIVVHIEPIYELYNSALLLDNIAMRYHRKRNYLHGYLPYLRHLESKGEIEIIEQRRTHVGSLFHEAYSLIVWRIK